jgi:hypothetical protein
MTTMTEMTGPVLGDTADQTTRTVGRRKIDEDRQMED